MAHQAIYRKWRPMVFEDIVGQGHITQTLKNQILNDKIGHAYLFCGTRGTGKTTCAKVLSRAVNCLNPHDGSPCNECEVCKGILDGSILDVKEIDAASNNGVDNIREIRDDVRYVSTNAKYTVYIIDEVHMLSTGAFNALLKTLEEPPEHVIFILATTEAHKVPQTILSRCQRFDFKKISNEDIAKRLKYVAKESNIEIKSQLKIYDKNLDELSPKQLEYLNIKEISDNTIRIQAQFWKVKQNVKIKAEYSGEPKRGYEVDSINLVPDTISVAGTDEALKKLEQEGNTLEIPGKYIDVTDKTGDFEQNIDLSELLPEDLKLVRDLNSSVIATVKILPYNSRDYEVSVTQIEADNKAEDLDLVFQDEQITIRAKAKEQDLDSLSAANIQVQIDLSGYGEGEYEVPVTVTLPGGYELVESIKVKVKLVPGAEK